MQLAGITIENTANLVNPNTRLCVMVYAPPKFGKTTFAATLDELTREQLNKPALVIAVEPGEGGGTMSIKDYNLDYVVPPDFKGFGALVAALHSDTHYGGVILDSSSEYVKRYLQPYALGMPNIKEKSQQRDAGVPGRSDYQTMGEQARIDFNRLIALTVHPDLKVRKHLVVTALEKEKTADDGRTVVAIQPDLPGAMSAAATAMFQTVACVKINQRLKPNPANPREMIRTTERSLITAGDGVRVLGDRTKLFPAEGPMNLRQIWNENFVPYFANRAAATTAV